MRKADDAVPLADATGDPTLVPNARGNAAVARMNAGEFADALEMFESLAEYQQAVGEEQGLETTRTNLAACRTRLGDLEHAAFDTSTGDLVNLFNEAQRLSLLDRHDAAIPLFAQALEAADAIDDPSVSAAMILTKLARTLFSAGRFDESTAAMARAAHLAEATGDLEALEDATEWLGQVEALLGPFDEP
jgi:tetratricopeptide (TPR) repeat protein